MYKITKNERYLVHLRSDYMKICKFSRDIDKVENFDKLLGFSEKLIIKEENSKNCDSTYGNNLSLSKQLIVLKNQRDSKFMKNCFLSLYLWIVIQLIYYCTLTNLDKFQESINNSFLLFFTSYTLSNLFIAFFGEKIGIKESIIIFSFLTEISLIFLIIYGKDKNLSQIFFFLFNFVENVFLENVYLFLPDLFEANVRSTSLSWTKIPAKFLLIIAPFFIGNNMDSLFKFFLFLVGPVPIVVFISN